MKNNDLDKIKEQLLNEKEENNNKMLIYDERHRIAKLNSFEDKAITTLGLSMFGYLLLFVPTSAIIKKSGGTMFLGDLPLEFYPFFLMGGSLGFGTIAQKGIEKFYKTKERLRNFTDAKTEKGKLTEELFYQIELKKIENRNKVIDNSIKTIESNQLLLSKLSSKYNIVNKKENITEDNINNLKTFIEESYKELDILSTQKVLHDRFWRLRSKYERRAIRIIAPLAGGVAITFFAVFPSMMLVDSSIYSTLVNPFITLAVGALGSNIYLAKRNKNYKKIFDKFNLELGDNKLVENYKKFEGAFEEQQELEQLIENKIREISLAKVELMESTDMLEKNNEEEVFIRACEKNNVKMRKATEEELEKGISLIGDDGKEYLVSKDQEAIEVIDDTLDKKNVKIRKRTKLKEN